MTLADPAKIHLGSRLGATTLEYPRWSVRMLAAAPLIAAARHFVFPRAVPGEEDALARGSVYFDVRPATGPAFLAQCALGYASPDVAHGLWPLPANSTDEDAPADGCLAVAGGYAYLLRPEAPEITELLPLRPVLEIVSAAACLVLAGHHDLLVLPAGKPAWRSPRLTWEGLTLSALHGTQLAGTGWDMLTDEEVSFTLDLATQELQGGGYRV